MSHLASNTTCLNSLSLPKQLCTPHTHITELCLTAYIWFRHQVPGCVLHRSRIAVLSTVVSQLPGSSSSFNPPWGTLTLQIQSCPSPTSAPPATGNLWVVPYFPQGNTHNFLGWHPRTSRICHLWLSFQHHLSPAPGPSWPHFSHIQLPELPLCTNYYHSPRKPWSFYLEVINSHLLTKEFVLCGCFGVKHELIHT